MAKETGASERWRLIGALGIIASFLILSFYSVIGGWSLNYVDESAVYPRVAKFLADCHGLGAMSRAHRKIIHLARLLHRLAEGLSVADIDHYLIRDAQHIIESIEALVRIHNAQEEDIYEHAIGA